MTDVFRFIKLLYFLAMRSLHILLSLLGLGVLVSCKKSGYETKDGAVYYKDYRLSEADYASFQILNDMFAKDRKSVYYRGVTIIGADCASFSALNEHYGKDNTTAFYCDNYLDFKLFESRRKDRIIPILGAEARTFEVIELEYAKDRLRCYFKETGFAVKDVASFKPLDYPFGRDNEMGYFKLKPIPGSHGRFFTVLSAHYAKDDRHVYYSSEAADGKIHLLKEAVPDSFSVIGMNYATDQVHAFYRNNLLPSADPVSFRQWDQYTIDYALDSTSIYFQDKRIEQADKATFRLLADDYAQDHKTAFYKNNPLISSHVTSFTVLQSGYAKDTERVYFEGKILTKADATSFALVDNDADRDAADRQYSYKEGKRIKLN